MAGGRGCRWPYLQDAFVFGLLVHVADLGITHHRASQKYRRHRARDEDITTTEDKRCR